MVTITDYSGRWSRSIVESESMESAIQLVRQWLRDDGAAADDYAIVSTNRDGLDWVGFYAGDECLVSIC